MRTGDIVYCVKDYYLFYEGDVCRINQVFEDGGGMSRFVPIHFIEEYFDLLSLERKKKLDKLNNE